MRITTGTISNGAICLDEPIKLPDKMRVKIVVVAIGPQLNAGTEIPCFEEDVELVTKARKRLGKITKRECG